MDRTVAHPAEGGRLERRHRWVVILLWTAFLALLTAGLEGAARYVVAHARDPMLPAVLANYRALAARDLRHFRFCPDHELPYRLTPGYVLHTGDGASVTRHNASGFRSDREFGPKEPGVLRIVCIGGSTTYGAGVADNAGTYPDALEGMLNGDRRPPGWSSVEVLNLGVGGYTSAEDVENLRRYGLPLDPDVVLIQSGINDVTARLYPGFRCDYGHFRKRLEPLAPSWPARLAYRSQFVVVLGYRLGLFDPLTLQSRAQHPMPEAAEAVANLHRNGTECFERNLEACIALCREAGVQVFLLTHPYFDAPPFHGRGAEGRLLDAAYVEGASQHNAVVRRVAERRGVPAIDLDHHTPRLTSLFSDPVHMTEAGNLSKARIVADALDGRLPAPP